MPSKCSSLSGLRLYPRVTSWSTSPRPLPRGLTPQWQILRNLHSSRTSCRIPLYTKSSLFGSRRGYAETAKPDSTALPPIRKLNSAILIPSSVKDTQPDTIVNHIQPLPRSDVYRNTFCVFLVTPSFAPWLVDDEFFLAKAIRRAFSNAHRDLPIQAICAVVDKLPAGRAMTSGMPFQDIVKQRYTEPPVGDPGFEGIAYVMLPSSASVPSTAPRSPDKGAIDFILSGHTGAKRPYSDTWRLPLANTVFQTGSPTTMYYTNWTLDAKDKALALQERTDVTHHGVRMAASGTGSGQMSSVLSIPLLPLTFPRTVEGGMGNIIRRIIDDEGQSVTAASELEKVVPRFFKARGESAQPTTAWALVMRGRKRRDKEIKTKWILGKNILKSEKGKNMYETLWDRLWQSNPTRWATYVSTAIAEGASLHRVLSGGGGWGKKAGLLSLDPVPVSEEVPIRMEDATSGFEGPGDFSTALTPVVRDGDAIQFFIAPTSASEVDGDKALENLKSLPKQRALGWELGTIPSTVDSFPGGSWQHVGADSEYIAVFRNSFGALSEGGMTLTRRRAEGRQHPFYTFGTTTIDVPYSRLWSVELADEDMSNNDIKFSWQHESQQLLHRLEKRDPKLPPLIRKTTTANASKSGLISEQYSKIADAITVLTQEQKSVLRFIHEHRRRTVQQVKLLCKLLIAVERDVENGGFVLYQLRIMVNRISHRMWTRFSRARREQSLQTHRYPVMPGEVRIHRFVSGSSDGNSPEIETSIAEKQAAREKHRLGVPRQRQRVVDFSEFLRRTPSIMDEDKHLADRRLSDGFGVVSTLEKQVNDLDASTCALHNGLRTALAALDRLERITHATNKSAFQIYSTHVDLHLRLLKMVRSRQGRADRPGRAHKYMHVPLLEAHMAQLQAFDEMLFAPGTKTTPEQLRKSLNKQVYQHPVQQYLTRRVWLQVGRNITNASQQAFGKLRVRHHLTYASESRARRPSQPEVRFQMPRPPPANRARIRRHYASLLRVKKHASIRPRQRNSGRRRTPMQPRKRAKEELLQTVSSWLGGATSVSKMAGAARRVGRSRPFGSKVFGNSAGEGGVENEGGDDGKT